MRANSGRYNFGAQGAGSPTHLTGVFFSQQTGNSMVYVPYKGTPELVRALLTDDIQVAFPTLTAVAGQVRAGTPLGQLGGEFVVRWRSVPFSSTIVFKSWWSVTA